jgi:hypothetical protein
LTKYHGDLPREWKKHEETLRNQNIPAVNRTPGTRSVVPVNQLEGNDATKISRLPQAHPSVEVDEIIDSELATPILNTNNNSLIIHEEIQNTVRKQPARACKTRVRLKVNCLNMIGPKVFLPIKKTIKAEQIYTEKVNSSLCVELDRWSFRGCSCHISLEMPRTRKTLRKGVPGSISSPIEIPSSPVQVADTEVPPSAEVVRESGNSSLSRQGQGPSLPQKTQETVDLSEDLAISSDSSGEGARSPVVGKKVPPIPKRSPRKGTYSLKLKKLRAAIMSRPHYVKLGPAVDVTARHPTRPALPQCKSMRTRIEVKSPAEETSIGSQEVTTTRKGEEICAKTGNIIPRPYYFATHTDFHYLTKIAGVPITNTPCNRDDLGKIGPKERKACIAGQQVASQVVAQNVLNSIRYNQGRITQGLWQHLLLLAQPLPHMETLTDPTPSLPDVRISTADARLIARSAELSAETGRKAGSVTRKQD